MKRPLATVVIALALTGCGSGEEEASPPARDSSGPPAEGTTAPGGPGQFPPQFVECMEEQGIDVSEPAAIHSPQAQEAFQACLRFLHP